MDEVLTLVTDDDQILGPIPRSQVHGNPSLIHRSVHILVINPDGQLLLQKRSHRKDVQPGKWDTSVGGHVGFGQDYEDAACREAVEEIGISPKELIFLYSSKIRNAVESENIHTFLHLSAGPFQHEPDEIDELRFWSKKEIIRSLGTGVFTANFEEEFGLFLGSTHARLLN